MAAPILSNQYLGGAPLLSAQIADSEAPAGTLTLGTPSVTSSSISLPWAYSAADHDGIEYRYRLTAGTWSAWIDAGMVSPIEITGLTSGAEYEVEAQAYNSAGVGTPQPATITIGGESADLSADPASIAITASDATLTYTRSLTLVAGPSSYTLTASNAGLTHARALRLVADPAAYTLTASDASLTYAQALTLAAYPSSFTITASDATLVHATPNRTLSAGPATYAISTNAAALIHSRILSAEPSTHVIASNNATLLRGRALQAEPVSHTIGAFDATLIYNTPHKVLVADASSIVISPAQAALEADRRLVAEPSTMTVTANPASMLRGRTLPAEPTSYAITALDAALFIATTDRVLSAEPSAYILTSAPAALLWSGATTPYLNRSVFVQLGEQRPFARTQEPRIFTRAQ